MEDATPVLEEREFNKHVVAYLTQIAVPLGTYVVSIHPKTAFRRLHFTGSCAYRPGLDAKLFEQLGPDMPDVSLYHARCKSCFRTASDLPRPEGFDTASSSGSSSESED